MPITFRCPHCGKESQVADQYAGQSGPCGACGKPITIPLASSSPAAPPPALFADLTPSGTPISPASPTPAPTKSSGGGATVVIIIVSVLGFMGLGCAGVLVALLLPAVQSARSAARRMHSTNNIRQIGLAMHNYHDVYGSFPPAVVNDANGNPLYSGRVLLLPFMEQYSLYEQFDKDKAWNDPANITLSETLIMGFKDPANPDKANPATDYFFVVGPQAVFTEDGTSTKFQQCTDGTSNTICVINAKIANQSWAEPFEVTASSLAKGLPPSYHPNGNIVLTADGATHFLPPSTSPTDLQAMATRNGGEVVFLP